MSRISVSERACFLKSHGRALQGRNADDGQSQNLRLERGFKVLIAHAKGLGFSDRIAEAGNV